MQNTHEAVGRTVGRSVGRSVGWCILSLPFWSADFPLGIVPLLGTPDQMFACLELYSLTSIIYILYINIFILFYFIYF
jgi:hypothetical protein